MGFWWISWWIFWWIFDHFGGFLTSTTTVAATVTTIEEHMTKLAQPAIFRSKQKPERNDSDWAIDKIKTDVSIVDLISKHFSVTGRGDVLTTTEHDSLKIFTKTNSWTWYSQSGAKGSALGGSTIDWVMWANDCDKAEAIRILKEMAGIWDSNDHDSNPVQHRQPKEIVKKVEDKPKPDWMTTDWQSKYTQLVSQAHEALMTGSAGSDGADYLLGRGLPVDVWEAFNLGYAVTWHRELERDEPAIVIPWYTSNGGMLRGVRFRFLNQYKIGTDKDGCDVMSSKVLSASGKGQMQGGFFGTQALEDWVLSLSTLVITEGELNGCAIWHVASHTKLNVLSLGSENAKLSDAQIDYAKQYKHILCWFDKSSVAQNQISRIPGAVGIVSPNGKDANDLLKSGDLGGFLTMCRYKACKTDHDKDGVLWDIWEGKDCGLDNSTKLALHQIAKDLGKSIQV